MGIKFWICISIITISLICMLLTKKIRCLDLFKDTLLIFKDNRTKKIYSHDIIAFFVCPIAISIAIVVGFDFYFSCQIANTLLTTFSIIFTLLFGVLSLLTSSLDSENKTKSKISSEAFTAVSFCMFSSFCTLLFLIVYIILIEKILNIVCFQILSAIIMSLGINMIMVFLMVIKRSYITSTFDDN